MKKYGLDGDGSRVGEQLCGAAREQLGLSVCGLDLIQPRLSEQGITNVSLGGGILEGRPLLTGWVTVSITTSQLALVEQGRPDEVDDIHLALHERGLEAVAHIHLTGDGVSLSGWENIPLEVEMSPTENFRWLHDGMVASHASNTDDHQPSPQQE